MTSKTKVELYFLVAVLCTFVGGIAVGYREGVEDLNIKAVEAYRQGVEDGRREAERENHVQLREAVPCDTDADCLKKNGCGGYADPCNKTGDRIMRTEEEIEQIMKDLKAGHNVDLSLSNGIVRSSKDAWMQQDGTVTVWHAISDAESNFTPEAFLEVLRGKRDIWDGDLPNDDDDEEEGDNDLGCLTASIDPLNLTDEQKAILDDGIQQMQNIFNNALMRDLNKELGIEDKPLVKFISIEEIA